MIKKSRFMAYLFLAWALFRLAIKPGDTERVFDIGEALSSLGLNEFGQKILVSHPENAMVVQKRKLLGEFDLQELQKLPLGTLGRSYADHMIQLKLDPEFFREVEIQSDVGFVIMRMRQTHDLWHIVTGFDTSVPGEVGLQSFMAAQTRLPISPVLMGGLLLRCALRVPETLPATMDSITRGWALGKKAKPVFAFDWESNWQKPLLVVRAELSL